MTYDKHAVFLLYLDEYFDTSEAALTFSLSFHCVKKLKSGI